MTALVVVLLLTNLVTLAIVLLPRLRRPESVPEDAEVLVCPRPAGVKGRQRRVISIEILNPIELVSSRGRVAGLAGTLAPGFAKRVVYDQTLKILRRELADKQVVADVKLHTLVAATKPERPLAVDVVEVVPTTPVPTPEPLFDPAAAAAAVSFADEDEESPESGQR